MEPLPGVFDMLQYFKTILPYDLPNKTANLDFTKNL